jgi:hypothetical protein
MVAKTILEQKTNFTQDHDEYLRPKHGYHPWRRATKEIEKLQFHPRKKEETKTTKCKILSLYMAYMPYIRYFIIF